MRTRRPYVAGLFLAGAAGYLATLALIGTPPLPPDWGARSTQARTIALQGGSFGPVADPPAIPAVGGGNPLVSFQGRLTNPSTGLPVPNGSYSITFRIFDAPTGGSATWTETQGAVAVTGGLFNVLLGSVTPLYSAVFDGPARYLEVQVGPDPAMTPRLQFSYVPYAFQAEQAGALNRLGSNVTAVDSTGVTGVYTSIAIGADGLPIISYYDDTDDDLEVAHCGNAACNAGNTLTTVDSAGSVGRFTAITVGVDGLPVISYIDDSTSDLKVAHCGNLVCNAGNALTTVDSTGVVGVETSITVGVDGVPVISYHDATNLDLKVAHCGNVFCNTPCGVGGTTCTTEDSIGTVGEFTSITVGANGTPVVSYYDRTNADLKVLSCGNAACSAGNTLTGVDTTGAVGALSSITVGTDGLPVISYYDATNGDLKVAHCGNVLCNTACGAGGTTCTPVDSTGDVGFDSSIAVGTEGLPVVSYYDNTNQKLKVANCGNASCSSGNTLTTVDSSGSVGRFTSITIGTDGLPVISYINDSTSDLKVAHCSNRFCLPNHRPR